MQQADQLKLCPSLTFSSSRRRCLSCRSCSSSRRPWSCSRRRCPSSSPWSRLPAVDVQRVLEGLQVFLHVHQLLVTLIDAIDSVAFRLVCQSTSKHELVLAHVLLEHRAQIAELVGVLRDRVLVLRPKARRHRFLHWRTLQIVRRHAKVSNGHRNLPQEGIGPLEGLRRFGLPDGSDISELRSPGDS